MSDSEANQKAGGRWLSWTILLILMAVAFALRWRYIQEISLSVDEFNTIWAARNVPVRGVPSFPSGNIYPHGFVFTYLTVPFVLGELNEAVARLPGLLVSLAALPAAYWVGRKLFSTRVGIFAAAALAVDPAGIVWGGRARMYGLLQLLVILIVYFFYKGLVDDRPRDRYLAMGLTVVAIFTHLEAALLLPALGLAMLLAWPWKQALRWSVIGPFAMAAVGAGVFFLISKYGQPGHLETLQDSRPYLEFTADVLTGPRVFAPVFFDLHRLPFTLLSLVGIYFVFRPRFYRLSPLTYFYVVLVTVLGLILILAGPTWQNARYLFFLLPLLYFTAGESLCRLLDKIPALRPTIPWRPAILALVVVVYVGLLGTPTAYVQEVGYDLAFRHLRDDVQLAENEVITTLSPSACALYMDECDRFAIQHGYEEFLIKRPGDGVLADLWTATQVLTETADFVELLDTAPRVWFVSDGWRFQTRYDPDFIQTVLDQMELVYDERGVMIWRGEGYAPSEPPAVEHPRQADFDEALHLEGFGLSPEKHQPGGEVEIKLRWQSLGQAGVAYTAFLHLLDAEGNGVAGIDEPVLGGYYQPDLWPEGTTFVDLHKLSLLPDLPPGLYRLDLGLYPTGESGELMPVEGADRLPLAMLSVGDLEGTPPTVAVDANFDKKIGLEGYDLDCGHQPLSCTLVLHWQAQEPMERSYSVFVHIVGPDGSIVAQADGPPGNPFFPTSTWLPGDRILDERTLSPDSAPPSGEYTVLVGIYHQPSGDRLPVTTSGGELLGDTLPLTTLAVGSESP